MFRWGIISVFLPLLILASGGLLYAEGKDSPFSVGQAIEKYKISDIDKHCEYWRLNLVNGISKTAVEVRARLNGDSPWSTKHYLVQPAPGYEAPDKLLQAVLSVLQEWKKTDKKPFVFFNRSKTNHVQNIISEHLWLFLVILPLLFVLFKLLRFSKSGTIPKNLQAQSAQRSTSTIVLFLTITVAAMLFQMLLGFDGILHIENINSLSFLNKLNPSELPDFSGGRSSYSLQHGNSWQLFLFAAHKVGLDYWGIQILLVFFNAIATGLVFLFYRNRRSESQAITASLLFMFIALSLSAYPTLSNTRLLPLMLIVFYIFFARLTDKGSTGAAIFSSALLALCSDMHMVNLFLVPILIFTIALKSRTPYKAVLYSGLVFAALLFTLSLETQVANLLTLWHGGFLFLGLLVFGLSLSLGCALRDKLADADTRELSNILIVIYIPLCLSLLFIVQGGYLAHRFFLPILPILALLWADMIHALLNSDIILGRRRLYRISMLVAIIIPAYLTYLYALPYQAKPDNSAWTMKEIEITAQRLAEHGIGLEKLESSLQCKQRAGMIKALKSFYPEDAMISGNEILTASSKYYLFRSVESAITSSQKKGILVFQIGPQAKAVLVKVAGGLIPESLTACYKLTSKQGPQQDFCLTGNSQLRCELDGECPFLLSSSDISQPSDMGYKIYSEVQSARAALQSLEIELQYRIESHAGADSPKKVILIERRKNGLINSSWQISEKDGYLLANSTLNNVDLQTALSQRPYILELNEDQYEMLKPVLLESFGYLP